MTNKEAIKVLQVMRNAIERGEWICSNDNEALDMAIEALSETKRDLSEGDAISRQDAIEELRDVIVKDVQFGDELTDGYNDGIDMAITVISKLPSAQPERKKGKWIHDGSDWTNRWICSQCGYKWFFDKPNYCPNCGADMIVQRWTAK